MSKVRHYVSLGVFGVVGADSQAETCPEISAAEAPHPDDPDRMTSEVFLTDTVPTPRQWISAQVVRYNVHIQSRHDEK
jgi:hypothetical protein